MAKTGFLSKQRDQIKSRLDELRPHYEEYLTLEKVQEALDQVEQPIRRAISRRGPGRPPSRRAAGQRASARTTTRRTSARGATRRRGGTRADQTLAVIKRSPGVTIPELAEKLGMRPNYLYRVTASLERAGLIRRRNGGFHPKP